MNVSLVHIKASFVIDDIKVIEWDFVFLVLRTNGWMYSFLGCIIFVFSASYVENEKICMLAGLYVYFFHRAFCTNLDQRREKLLKFYQHL